MSTVPPRTAVRHPIGRSEQVPEGGRFVVDIGATTVGVFRFKSTLYAYENVCAHSGGPVCQGRLVPRVRELLDEAQRTVGAAFDEDDLHIVCPWHGAEYSVTTGAHPAQPLFTLRGFPVDEEGGTVYVTL
jgi:nitrite reductase/ring-hydroxylating ferredoxin subunit